MLRILVYPVKAIKYVLIIISTRMEAYPIKIVLAYLPITSMVHSIMIASVTAGGIYLPTFTFSFK